MLATGEFKENSLKADPKTLVEISETALQQSVSDPAEVTNRLTNLSINKSMTETIPQQQPLSQKSGKSSSNSRPLTLDDDDLDLDLELDDNIDTSVSKV